MVTLHATARRTSEGFKPMVIVRNAQGRCHGSRVSHSEPFDTAIAARAYALDCAHKVAARLAFARVA